MPYQVAVCGPRGCSEEEWRHAYDTGRLLAEREAVVVCGGQGGVMAAVAGGARSSGGIVVGVLPAADRSAADPSLTVVIPTGLGEGRNNVIVNSADAVIVIGGSWGTLSEIALAMRAGRVPVVQLGGWHVLDERRRPMSGIRHASTPAQAVELTGLWP